MTATARRSEHAEQTLLVQWAALRSTAVPELRLLFAVPNGGHRRRGVAGKLKAEGVRRGVPDLCLPVPRGEYAGLWIEMKAMGGYASAEQRWWITELTRQGYRAVVCRGFEAAKRAIEDYLAG